MAEKVDNPLPLVLLKTSLIQRLMQEVYGRKMTEKELFALRQGLKDDAVTRMLKIMGPPPERKPQDPVEAIMREETDRS